MSFAQPPRDSIINGKLVSFMYLYHSDTIAKYIKMDPNSLELLPSFVADSIIHNYDIKVYRRDIPRKGYFSKSNNLEKGSFIGSIKEYMADLYNVDSVRVLFDPKIKYKGINASYILNKGTTSRILANYIENLIDCVSKDTTINTEIWVLKKNQNFQDTSYQYDTSFVGGSISSNSNGIDCSNIDIYSIKKGLEKQIGTIIEIDEKCENLYFTAFVPIELLRKDKIMELSSFLSKNIGHHFEKEKRGVVFKYFQKNY